MPGGKWYQFAESSQQLIADLLRFHVLQAALHHSMADGPDLVVRKAFIEQGNELIYSRLHIFYRRFAYITDLAAV